MIQAMTGSARAAEAISLPAQSFMIVCGAPEYLQRLRASLPREGVKLTWCVTTEEISGAPDDSYDLVVVDVATEQLFSVLRAVREKTAGAVVLVPTEGGRLGALVNQAGVFPRYRAMPCSYSELTKLIQWQLAPSAALERSVLRLL